MYKSTVLQDKHKNYTKKEDSKMGFYHLFFCFKDILHIKVQEFNVISWFKLKSSSFSQLSAQFSIYGSFLIWIWHMID